MFQPYHPDQEVTIGDLTIQSSEDSIALFGQAWWRRDQHSLRQLRALLTNLAAVESALANTPNLPETAPDNDPPLSGPAVSNPF